MIRFSVITVVRNNAPGVIRTLQSVFSQTYGNYEIIVQDGASTDETSDILRGFGNWIDSLVIEPDSGIYDAMNRALRRATGDYCIFMNAADFFVNGSVLEEVSTMLDPENDDIWTGQAMNDELGVIHKFRPPDKFWAGSTFDHQAAFIRTSLLKELEHDTRYKIVADQHFFTRARKQGARFKYEDFVVVRKPFDVGASSDFIVRLKDRLDMLDDAWGDTYPVKDQLTSELRANTVRTFGIDPDLISSTPIDVLLAEREKWHDLLK